MPRKRPSSKHAYSAVLAIVLTAVMVPFNPGIPWFAWVAALVILYFVAELTQSIVGVPSPKSNTQRYRQAIWFAVILAVLLLIGLTALLKVFSA